MIELSHPRCFPLLVVGAKVFHHVISTWSIAKLLAVRVAKKIARRDAHSAMINELLLQAETLHDASGVRRDLDACTDLSVLAMMLPQTHLVYGTAGGI